MAITSGYFNSVNGDRKYNADQMSEYFEGIINEGVCQHIDGGLAVTAGTGLSVNVAAGKAFIGKKWIRNDASLTLTISAASSSYARIDAVVLRRNNTTRTCQIVVKSGTPAASPVAPTMTRNSTTYEMALAYVNVAANATSVTVTDKRADTTVCGWATVAESVPGEIDAQLNAMKTGFDGVTYASPAAMVQGCDQKLQDDVNVTKGFFYDNERELINGINTGLSGYYDSTGVFHSASGWKAFYIGIIPGASYLLKLTGLTYSSSSYYCEFDKNGNFIKNLGIVTWEKDIVFSTNAYYIGFGAMSISEASLKHMAFNSSVENKINPLIGDIQNLENASYYSKIMGISWANGGPSTTIGQQITFDGTVKRAHGTNRVYLTKGSTISNNRYFINRFRVDEDDILLEYDNGWTAKSRTIDTDGYYYFAIADDPTTANVNVNDINIECIYINVEEMKNKIHSLEENNMDAETYTLCDNSGTRFFYNGLAFDTSAEGNHASWTNSNVFYDQTLKQYVVVYNMKQVHSLKNGKVYCRTIKNGVTSNGVVVADQISNGYSSKCQACGMDGDGNYLAFVARFNNQTEALVGIFIYKSSDGGETWTPTELKINNASVTDVYSGDVCGYLLTSTSRILVWAMKVNKESTIIYSDDDGATWNRSGLGFYDVTEPCYIELDNNIIVGYARYGVNSQDAAIPAVFIKSEDNGSSWTEEDSQLLTDMCNNNGTIIKHTDNSGKVEIIYGSRHTQNDGYGSIFQVVTTQAMIENDLGKNPVRIGKFNSLANDGDGGYFGSGTSEEGETYVFYYDGTKSSAIIKELHGFYQKVNYGDTMYNQLTDKLEVWVGNAWSAIGS